MTISLLSFGFFQFAHWPIVLTLVSRYFNEKNEGAQLGCWSATGDIGNIAGFMLGAVIVIYLKGSW
jgi:sugar phosphate permease